MNAGETFRFADPRVEEHLWIVISDPGTDVADPVVIVRLTTLRRGRERTCILDVGDHPFITHVTVVDYGAAMEVADGNLDGMLGSALAYKQEPMRADVLSRIREGASESPEIPLGCRGILVKQGLIEE